MTSELEYQLRKFRIIERRVFIGPKKAGRIKAEEVELMLSIINDLELEFYNIKALSER